jgi:coproporphyrinogen III oxidase
MDWSQRAADHFTDLQQRIVTALEQLDGGATFRVDDWQKTPADARPDSPVLGGWGRTRVLEGGRVFERAGVNFSFVEGRFAPDYADRFPGDGLDFTATGISLVLHPHNPHAPTVHLNYRRLQRGSAGWFGGGADLTPAYLYEEDARHFHEVHRAACLRHAPRIDHAALKAECDRYFHLPHRGEARGIGGIFFDHLTGDPEALFAFVQDAGEAFLPSYLPVVSRRHAQPFTEAERRWQLLRRGRYVEFNLVVDRGTLFGLRTGGRIESILMSLPATACWTYDHHPEPGTPEAALVEVLRQPRDWCATP